MSQLARSKSTERDAVQERHFNPRISTTIPESIVTYTRGSDLSGELQAAGGIGGLLARSEAIDGTVQHAYYHADAGGNVTTMTDAKEAVARYLYDPFGNQLSSAGPLAEANTMRFSSKELISTWGVYYYGYRFYDPNLQRWLNRDPIQERGSLNLFLAFLNNGLVHVDINGLVAWKRILKGCGEVTLGVAAAFGIAVAEAPSAGSVSLAIPTVFCGITHGMLEIGAGIEDDPKNKELKKFLEVYPADPGDLITMAFPSEIAQPLDFILDLTSLGTGTFGVLNTVVENEHVALEALNLLGDSALIGMDWYDSLEKLNRPTPPPNSATLVIPYGNMNRNNPSIFR